MVYRGRKMQEKHRKIINSYLLQCNCLVEILHSQSIAWNVDNVKTLPSEALHAMKLTLQLFWVTTRCNIVGMIHDLSGYLSVAILWLHKNKKLIFQELYDVSGYLLDVFLRLHNLVFMKPEDGIGKIFRKVVYHSYNITPRYNPKEVQQHYTTSRKLPSYKVAPSHEAC